MANERWQTVAAERRKKNQQNHAVIYYCQSDMLRVRQLLKTPIHIDDGNQSGSVSLVAPAQPLGAYSAILIYTYTNKTTNKKINKKKQFV